MHLSTSQARTPCVQSRTSGMRLCASSHHSTARSRRCRSKALLTQAVAQPSSSSRGIGPSSIGQQSLSSGSKDDKELPKVDWSRYHLQVLFVDRTDTVLARLATGLFERVAEWNGWGRVLLPSASGLETGSSSSVEASTTATLMAQAMRLKIRPKLFASPPDQLVREDLDRFDLIVAIDGDLKQEVMDKLLDSQDPYDREWWTYYTNKVTSLVDFSEYASEETLLAKGGFALLSGELKRLIAASPSSSRVARLLSQGGGGPDGAGTLRAMPQPAAESPASPSSPAGAASPVPNADWPAGAADSITAAAAAAAAAAASVGSSQAAAAAAAAALGAFPLGSSQAGPQEGDAPGSPAMEHIHADLSGSLNDWDTTVAATLLCCAGLVRYLVDSYPPDLPEYDPL